MGFTPVTPIVLYSVVTVLNGRGAAVWNMGQHYYRRFDMFEGFMDIAIGAFIGGAIGVMLFAIMVSRHEDTM